MHPNPWKSGDRVRVKDDAPYVALRGRAGTVKAAARMSLGIPNDYNTRVALDEWTGSGEPIFHDGVLEAE